MTNIYINKMRHYPFVLEYQLEMGPIKQLLKTHLPADTEYNRGYYVEVNHVFIGLFSSKNGPVFFYDKKEYFLADENYTSEVQKNPGEYIFSLKYKNEMCVEIIYPPAEDIDFDNWSTEENMDFFLWLTNALNTRRKKFVEYRTVHDE